VAEEGLGVLRVRKRGEARVAGEGRRRPFPDVAEDAIAPGPTGRAPCDRQRSERFATGIRAVVGIRTLRGLLPLRLRRESLAGPCRYRFCLVERDVLDRFSRRHRFPQSETLPLPASVSALPIERRLEALLPKPLPAMFAPIA